MRKFAIALSGLLVATVMAIGTPAAASTITYSLTIDHCSGGCGAGPYGSVALDDSAGSGNVDVLVTLTPATRLLMASGLGATFSWNLTTNVTVTTPNLPSTYTLLNAGAPGIIHMDGFGYFEYGVRNNTGNGGVNALPGPLAFTVNGTGLTIASFAAKSVNGSPSVFFALDIINGAPNGNTGPVGGGTCITGCGPDQHLFETPEPTSLVLLGSGLLAATRGLRRFKR